MVLKKEERIKLIAKEKIFNAEQQPVNTGVWYDDVPTKGENPSRQYPLIASIHQSIKEANNANHYDIKDIKKRGLHTRIDMLPFKDNPPDIGCTPAFATLFAKEDCKLYYRSQCNNRVYDLLGELVAEKQGYYKTSIGFIAQWDTTSAKNNTPIRFRIPFPVTCLGVVPVLLRSNSDPRSLHVKLNNTTREQWIPLTNATTGTTIFYIAIGV